MTAELATGLALTFLYGGADQVYLFNYFPTGHGLAKEWGLERYNTVIRSMREAQALAALHRVHAVTYRDVRATGDGPDHVLPATDSNADFQWPPGCAIRIQTGPKPASNRRVELLLEFEAGSVTPEKLNVYVNSTACNLKTGAAAPRMIYEVPTQILEDEAQVVEVVGGEPMSYRIVRVELAIR
jgi:hypothetical protein